MVASDALVPACLPHGTWATAIDMESVWAQLRRLPEPLHANLMAPLVGRLSRAASVPAACRALAFIHGRGANDQHAFSQVKEILLNHSASQCIWECQATIVMAQCL